MSKTLGLDIGIGSIGSALLNDDKVLYMGVRMFNSANEASDSRLHRSQRRNLARKKWRKEQLLDAFADFGVLTKEEIGQEGYLLYTTNNELIKKPNDKTVYHLRSRAIREQVTKREILLCLYNILHARGHFLNETIDFENGKTITFNDYSELFYNNCFLEEDFNNETKEEINQILKFIFDEKISKKDLDTKLKNLKTVIDADDEEKLKNTLYLISGFVSNIKKINSSFTVDKEKCNVKQLKTLDQVDDYLAACVELYDLQQIHKILNNHEYLCDAAVEKLDEFYDVIDRYGTDSKEFKDYQAKLKENSAKDKQKHIRVVRNLDNGYPNGLYLKECRAILRKQQEYYKEISNEFIDICADIISARIPYYIGPLNEEGKNAWVKKNSNIKYSYAYSIKNNNQVIDVAESVRKWKERMISHCTYLPDCYALPKGSFISETFNILNELNILKAIDENGDDYYLTRKDKFVIFDCLFLNKNKVAYDDVVKLLGLKSFGPRSGKEQYFNNVYTLYFSIITIIPELKLETIMEFVKNNEKINKIENIILGVNLYDEESTKIKHFMDEGYPKQISEKLAKLKSKSYCSYSKEFVMETPIDIEGNSIIDKLFEDNCSLYTNEQMTIIQNATDKDGRHVDYLSNKYHKRISKNNNELNYKILVDDDKPIIPISRPVLRSLNECMKVYLGIINSFGVPDRIIVETARDLPDFSVVKEKTVKFADNAEKQYKNLIEQLKQDDFKEYRAYERLDNYDEIKAYIDKNKSKIALYISQLGTDLLTGEKINLSNLDNYEIDHILPRGFGDDSMNDKMLIAKKVNAKKGNRLPIEFINSGEKVDGHNIYIESKYLENVSALFEIGAISEKKYKRLTLRNQIDLDEFLNQNLVDTRYIIREFMSILRAYNDIKGYQTHIVALKSAYTSTYRNAFYMDKDRGYGDQHHAHDAALLCIADKTLSYYYPNYDRRSHSKDNTSSPFASYNGLIASMKSNDDNTKDELNRFIRTVYKKAYNETSFNHNSIIEQVKNYIPYYSVKVERNYKGQYFELNPLSQKEYKNDAALSIIGVNDTTKVFSGVNCACVDFYKYTDSKGKKVHLAVHIPKVIIDCDGNINKEKYLKLIKQHYKANEILDEDGSLIEGYFKFRAFKNDLIYNTKHKTLFKYNIGSIANKKLGLQYVNIFSYNDIYELAYDIEKDIKSAFNIKDKNNKDGVEFKNIDKEEMVAFVNGKYYKLPISDKKLKTCVEKIEAISNLKQTSSLLAYLCMIINRPLTPPTIDGQCKAVVGSDIGKGDDDVRYVKLKYDILGIRAYENADGGFVIETPIPGKFKKITKEKFSWQVSKNTL